MSKNPKTINQIPSIISTTQRIEGYAEASEKVVQKVKALREKHGIKVSAKK